MFASLVTVIDRDRMRETYQANVGDLDRIVTIASEYGFCIVKGVFTPDEMANIGEDMRATNQDFQGDIPDLLSCPRLRRVMLDERVLSTARALMGDDLVYYGESSINYEEQAGPLTLKPYNHLHFDAHGMAHDIKDVWRDPANALFGSYRFGFYMRDYSAHSGGLKIAIGSHRGDPKLYSRNSQIEKSILVQNGKNTVSYLAPDYQLINVPSQPGDMVVWNLRTMHSAGARALIDHPDLSMLPSIEAKLHSAMPDLFAPIASPRNVIFFDYGAPIKSTDLYIKNRSQLLTSKILRYEQLRLFDGPTEMESAAANGIRLRFDRIAALLSVELLTLAQINAAAAQRDNIKHAISLRRNRLLAIITRHEEYSPHHQLFDIEHFRKRVLENAEEGVLECAQAIVDQLQRQGAGIVAEMVQQVDPGDGH